MCRWKMLRYTHHVKVLDDFWFIEKCYNETRKNHILNDLILK